MEQHTNFTDLEFEQQFESGTMDPVVFTHEAHLRLAWIHINKYGIDAAIENVCRQLVNFVTRIGAKKIYNLTVTVAAVKVVHHFMLRSNAKTFDDLIIEFPRLKSDFKTLIGQHYTRDIFNSTKAKKTYLEPDLLPFD